MMSGKPNTGQYIHKTKRLSGARYRLTLATPKDRQGALRVQKSPPIARQSAGDGRQIKPKFGSATAARDQFDIAVKQRALLFP
ncbi:MULTISPECIES: hypothetical protein [unclassified Rhizobium]|uniref:hypothetical protein n=1 Tax=unclassified Rhizobium TaxID=2613769 RepID=UPI0013C4C638|nr:MULTISPECIES: hypothetical protein [unclassified Rhizobium]